MNIKQLFADEDAVSPVIGVILMVAITVILAAVIGTFVLGLGENVQDSAPQANFQFEYGGSGDDITSSTPHNDFINVTHTGGEDVEADNVEVLVDGSTAAGGTYRNWTGAISKGDSLSIDESQPSTNVDVISGGETVRVVWTSPSGGNSNTIGQSTVPN